MFLSFSDKSAYRYGVIQTVLAFVLLFASSAFASGVVLLHSSDSASPWTIGLERGLSSELGSDAQVFPILLGSGDHDDDYFEDRYEALADQWQGDAPMVVVADGEAAFAFMRKYRELLFAGAPVLYCGMPRPEPVYLSQCGDCAGIPLMYPVSETVDFLFRLLPEAGTVVGIMDGTWESRRLRKQAELAMEKYYDRAQLVFPGHEPGDEAGLDMAGLASVASSVPRGGAVLFLGFRKDALGNSVDEGEAVRLLASRSAGPVFVLADWWLEAGVLGGIVVDAEAHGRAIAGMIQRISDGEAIREMLPEAVLPKAVADLTVMVQRSIPDERLPAGTVRLNAPQAPEAAESVVSTGLAALGVVMLVGVAWLLARRRAGR